MPVTFQIVIFAVIAAVLLFQLYNVLGKKVGRQPEDNPAPVAVGAPQGAAEAQRGPVLDPAIAAAIAGLKAKDPNFDPHRFLDGARQAYETIVTAYARGDREALRPLLTDKVLASFEAGITAREARSEVEAVELVHPPRADLEVATVENDRAQAKVRFLAEVRSTVTPSGGEAVSEERRTAEVWTFERRLGAADPNWALARVEPATA